MEDPREQLIKMASDAELERRWSAVRAGMRERGIDYLVMQNAEEFLGGTLRWFTDWTADIGFPYTVIFPVDDDMTVINWGFERPETPQFPPHWYLRGIKRSWASYYMPTHNYTNEIDASMAVEALSEKEHPVIGWVEKAMIPATFCEYVTRNLPGATFVDATDWIDEIRARKSPEEIADIRVTAAMQDACFDHLKSTIQPGMRGIDVYAEVMYFCSKRGCSRMNCMISSGQPGTPVGPAVYHLQGRTIKPGDHIFVLVEGNGPGGQWTELGRMFVVQAEPTPALAAAFAHSVEGQDLVAKLMVPGAACADVVRAVEAFNAERGYGPKLFDLAHGMGYSMVERPMMRKREPMKLAAGNNLAVHLSVEKEIQEGRVFAMCVDNYLIGENGRGGGARRDAGAERVHRFPRELILS
jgi:Xaa-Pro aminopeptidase